MVNTPFMVGTAFALFGGYMLRHAFRSYRKALASMDWPRVSGRLTEVRLWGRRNVGGEMKPVNHLHIEYEYDVKGTAYTGSAPAFYTLVYPETVAFAESHSPDSDVVVYYNPGEPAESVLSPGPKPGSKRYSDIILASLGLVVAVTVAVAGALGILD